MMKIELKLFASLARHVPDKTAGKSLVVELDDGLAVKDVLGRLKVPENEVKLIFINGVRGGKDSLLKDGDRVGVFPPVAGG